MASEDPRIAERGGERGAGGQRALGRGGQEAHTPARDPLQGRSSRAAKYPTSVPPAFRLLEEQEKAERAQEVRAYVFSFCPEAYKAKIAALEKRIKMLEDELKKLKVLRL